jgi:exodeoxyribonuclease-3
MEGQMRILTWNVNGLRAALKKGIWDWLLEASPDVICLQEIKAKPEQMAEEYLNGFQREYKYAFWNPAKRPGYSGVGTLLNKAFEAVELGLGEDYFDQEGRIVKIRFPDFVLFNVYFPNGGRDLARLNFKLEFYAHFLELCDEMHASGEKIVVCGDFNTAHREIDLRNPKQNQTTSGFLPEERAWIDCYLEHGFVDVYRYLYPERVQYTWWTYRFSARMRNIGWRLDYFMVSEALMSRVEDVVIYDEVEGSDHCPVALVLSD